MIIPAILSGGSGTRLWPLSRNKRPKQFMELIGENTLFYNTIKRVHGDKDFGRLVVSCNGGHVEYVERDLKKITMEADIIIEPVGRNTAPAIGAIASFLKDKCGEDDVILVLSSDHYIRESDKFLEYIKEGKKFAQEGRIVTFGIVPTRPETAYGYIRRGEKIGENAYDVHRIVEKPNIDTAWKFLEDPAYSWNAGIFMFKPSVILENIKEFGGDMLSFMEESLEKASIDENRIYLEKESFEKCEGISIDYAVMEKTKTKIATVVMDINWSDLGSFDTLYSYTDESVDSHNNVVKAKVYLENVKDSYIKSNNPDRVICGVGLTDIVIVDEGDVLLVMNKNLCQSIKGVISQIKTSEDAQKIL